MHLFLYEKVQLLGTKEVEGRENAERLFHFVDKCVYDHSYM